MRAFVMIAAIALSASLSGCGDDGPAKYAVSGTVTYKGEPIQDGEIAFYPVDGKGPPGGGPITDGHYDVEVTQGEKRVQFNGERDTGRTETLDDGKVINIREPFLPRKYGERSEIVTIIEPKVNSLDFPLN